MFFYRFKINSNGLLIAKLMFGSAFLFSLIFFPFSTSAELVGIFDDDFETYNLGDLNNQGGWQGFEGWQVVNTKKYQGVKSAYIDKTIGIGYIAKTGIETQNGIQSFWVQFSDNKELGSQIIFELRGNDIDDTTLSAVGIFYNSDTGKWNFEHFVEVDGGFWVHLVSDVARDEWHLVEILFDEPNWQFKTRLDGGEWFGWFSFYSPDKSEIVSALKSVRVGSGYQEVWIDTLNGEIVVVPPISRVWGISPETETIITDLDTNFVFGYEGLDFYDGLTISFYHKRTMIHTKATRFYKNGIGNSGVKVLNLQDFQFEKNADWHFHAIAFVEVPEISEGMFLTGRYGSEYTQNIVSPEYFLKIVIEGFSYIFEMEDWGTWYDEHAKFDEPTPLFERVALLFNPTFSNIGEFGQRISDYFEVDKAYSRGYELGLAIPMFSYYLASIEVFFGGLPLMKLFLMTLLLMVGIFLFKIIMKFIPFF